MKQESSEAVVEAAKTCCRLRSLKSGSVCGIRFAKRPIIAAICICVPSRLETSRQTSTNTKRVNVRQKALFRMSCWLRRPQKGDGSSRLSRIAVKTHTHTHKHKHKHTHARVQAMLAERPGRGKRRQGWQGLPGEPPGPDLESSSERYPETGAVRSFWGELSVPASGMPVLRWNPGTSPAVEQLGWGQQSTFRSPEVFLSCSGNPWPRWLQHAFVGM